jgi:hypothetical protein
MEGRVFISHLLIALPERTDIQPPTYRRNVVCREMLSCRRQGPRVPGEPRSDLSITSLASWFEHTSYPLSTDERDRHEDTQIATKRQQLPVGQLIFAGTQRNSLPG